jgi:hypothetical protein
MPHVFGSELTKLGYLFFRGTAETFIDHFNKNIQKKIQHILRGDGVARHTCLPASKAVFDRASFTIRFTPFVDERSILEESPPR